MDYYITAEIILEPVNRLFKIFTLGDGSRYGSYVNAALEKEKTYKVYERAISRTKAVCKLFLFVSTLSRFTEALALEKPQVVSIFVFECVEGDHKKFVSCRIILCMKLYSIYYVTCSTPINLKRTLQMTSYSRKNYNNSRKPRLNFDNTNGPITSLVSHGCLFD